MNDEHHIKPITDWQIIGTDLKVSFDTCPRCGGSHADLEFVVIANPTLAESHFATCPTTGHPIVCKINITER